MGGSQGRRKMFLDGWALLPLCQGLELVFADVNKQMGIIKNNCSWQISRSIHSEEAGSYCTTSQDPLSISRGHQTLNCRGKSRQVPS